MPAAYCGSAAAVVSGATPAAAVTAIAARGCTAAAGRAAGLHNQVAVGGYRTLLVAREAMRNQFAALVDSEEDAARRGVPAAICIKVRCRNAEVTC